MKVLLAVALAFALLVLESVVVHYSGMELSRIDVTLVLVVFLGLRAGLLEGAFAAFCVGYLFDVMSGQPTGLRVFLAVLTFLGVKLASSLVEVRSAFFFLLFVVGADVGHGLLAVFFNWMTSRSGALPTGPLTALPLQAALTGVVALLLWPLLRRWDPGSDRPMVGSLY